jgi:hypothetical protein
MSDNKISFSEDSSTRGSTGLQYLIPSNDVVFKNSQELLSVSPIGCDVRNSFSPNATSYDPWYAIWVVCKFIHRSGHSLLVDFSPATPQFQLYQIIHIN